jgi:glycosyltransferase involved in cell wall biosynthesis
VEGFETVEWLIIDDGSRDRTLDVAVAQGVDHIVCLPRNLGLARAFKAGLDACLMHGADVIVNVDADNQYCAQDIPALVKPILEGKADIVVGARPIDSIQHFSWTKKMLQKLGSWTVRLASSTSIADAPSGFRALTREAAMRMNVFDPYTHTLETIIQAGQKGMTILSVPVRVNEDLRRSRLLKSVPHYLFHSISTIVRMFVTYRPFRFFMTIGLAFFLAGFLVGLRYLYAYVSGSGEGHVQSLILASICMGIGFQTIMGAFLADMLAVNRRLMEDVQYRVRKAEEER